MKTALQILLLVLGATCAGAAFIGLIGIDSSVAFLTSETAVLLYPVAGLMLIGFNDYSRRRIIVLSPATKAGPVPAVGPVRRAKLYGINRRASVVV